MISFTAGNVAFTVFIQYDSTPTSVTVSRVLLYMEMANRFNASTPYKCNLDISLGGKQLCNFQLGDLNSTSVSSYYFADSTTGLKIVSKDVSGDTYNRGTVDTNLSCRVTGFVRLKWVDSYRDTEIDKTGSFEVPAQVTYKVTYDANGGTGAPAVQSKHENETIAISSQKPVRTGYDFAGWEGSDGNTYQPGDTYSANNSVTLLAIWGAVITFIGNGGGNVPAAIPKPKDVAVAIPDIIPTKAGYIFVSWNTASGGGGTTYSPGGVVPASMNSSLTLYAQWLKGPDPPTIDKLSTVRCDQQGNQDNDGTYCLVNCQWHIDTANIRNNSATVTGTITPQSGGASRTFAFESGYSGTSGTAMAILAGMDTDMQYTVTVKVTDKKTFSELSSILTRARFILDFKPGGFGMGIGSAAPTTGLEVGWDTQFDGNVKVLGTLTTKKSDYSKNQYTEGTDPTSSEMFDAVGSYASDRVTVQQMGRLIQVNIVVSANVTLEAGERDSIGTLNADIAPIESIGFANRDVAGYISAGGSISVIALKDWSGATEISAMYFGKE